MNCQNTRLGSAVLSPPPPRGTWRTHCGLGYGTWSYPQDFRVLDRWLGGTDPERLRERSERVKQAIALCEPAVLHRFSPMI
jgi:hypothetical protein